MWPGKNSAQCSLWEDEGQADCNISGIILSFPLVIGAVAQMAELYISPNHTRAACASLQLTPLSQFHI